MTDGAPPSLPINRYDIVTNCHMNWRLSPLAELFYALSYRAGKELQGKRTK
jgi:hypothetical protein